MSHHVRVRLPDGRLACADYRERAVVAEMRRVNAALAVGAAPPGEAYQAVAGWLDRHREQSAACEAGLALPGLPCGHG